MGIKLVNLCYCPQFELLIHKVSLCLELTCNNNFGCLLYLHKYTFHSLSWTNQCTQSLSNSFIQVLFLALTHYGMIQLSFSWRHYIQDSFSNNFNEVLFHKNRLFLGSLDIWTTSLFFHNSYFIYHVLPSFLVTSFLSRFLLEHLFNEILLFHTKTDFSLGHYTLKRRNDFFICNMFSYREKTIRGFLHI